ncbi:MAG: response regulator [Candidatus Thiodiazotropha sp. (ex Epidulcina cf. delphinae)]|nr:response regulator [Candidatus Thiodiazotropha sp. (ex Epidulcina cf. delphinae)]
MKQLFSTDLPADDRLISRDRNYYSLTFSISCILLAGLIVQYLLPDRQAVGHSTLTLAVYYTLIRLVQLSRFYTRHAPPPLMRRTWIILDHIYLGLIAFSGGPVMLIIPLSSLLLYATRPFGIGYLQLALPTAFSIILFTLCRGPTLQLELLHAIPLSLMAVLLPGLFPFSRGLTAESGDGIDTGAEKSRPGALTANTELQGTPHEAPPWIDKSIQRILILSNNENTIESASNHLIDWGHEFTSSRNCVQAFKHMLSRSQGGLFVPYDILIVDEQGLDIDLLSLARLINHEPTLAELRLICLKNPVEIDGNSQRLLRAGFSALLDTPLSKAQLFNAIRSEPQLYPESTNVISLSQHRTDKNADPGQREILLADTPSPERALLGKALIRAGHRVRIVDNGDQALDALEEQLFELAIVNARLPIMSGTQVVKLHRFTTPYKRWIPFIFVSDENTPDTLKLCQSIGVHACLFRPFTLNELLETITSVLSQSQSWGLAGDNYRRHAIAHGETRFQHTGLLDHLTLLRLEKLDNGIAFINDLFKIFEAEGQVILRYMHQAVERKQLGLFLDQAQILLDSAGQLGAFSLYELNQQAIKIHAHEFEYQGAELFDEIEKTFNLTLRAYTDYLSQRAASLRLNSK